MLVTVLTLFSAQASRFTANIHLQRPSVTTMSTKFFLWCICLDAVKWQGTHCTQKEKVQSASAALDLTQHYLCISKLHNSQMNEAKQLLHDGIPAHKAPGKLNLFKFHPPKFGQLIGKDLHNLKSNTRMECKR